MRKNIKRWSIRNYHLAWATIIAGVLLVTVLMLCGCSMPKEVGTAAIAARVDARATASELQAGYSTPATMPADTAKAIRHFQTISDLLVPVEAYSRKIDPAKVSK